MTGDQVQDHAIDTRVALYGATRGFLIEELPPAFAKFHEQLPAEPPLPVRQQDPSHLPVVGWLHDACDHAVPETQGLADALVRTASSLAWRQSYSEKEVSRRFLSRYGWTQLVGLRGPFASRHVACGFLLLGPNVEYPAHRHDAEEIYVILAGIAEWRAGNAQYTPRLPGSIIHHPPALSHAMRTYDEPMLALYLWRRGDLARKPEFV